MPRGFNMDAAERFFKSKFSWVLKTLENFKPYRAKPKIISGRREYLKFKAQALALATQKVKELNQSYNFNYQNIKIGNQKTRWGSCSKKGNLNFNYKIVHLPEHLLNYLIVHELCHLKEFNHSREFWQLVEKVIPDYKVCRKQLRSNILWPQNNLQ